MSNILINVDHGSLPACVQDIQTDLGIHDFQFGILGSLVYAGITIGSAISSWIFQNSVFIKPSLYLSLLLNAISLILFTATNYFYVDAILRVLIGIFQVIITIYNPVWADIFAKENLKSIWLTFLILGSPLGLVLGFALTSIMKSV
jgi:predicted MFS family arabinose efflux permease